MLRRIIDHMLFGVTAAELFPAPVVIHFRAEKRVCPVCHEPLQVLKTRPGKRAATLAIGESIAHDVECYYENSDLTVPTVTEAAEPETAVTKPGNQTALRAVELTSGEVHTGSYISHETDIDWYTITASRSASSFNIFLTQPSSAVGPRIKIRVDNSIWS